MTRSNLAWMNQTTITERRVTTNKPLSKVVYYFNNNRKNTPTPKILCMHCSKGFDQRYES